MPEISNPRAFEDGNQVQILSIGGNMINDTLNDYYGALANCTLKIGVVGKTTKDDKFIVEKYGIYIKDSYDFIGKEQPLGYWTYDKILSKGESYPVALENTTQHSLQNRYLRIKKPKAILIKNEDFLKYRIANNAGGDFFVFSDIYWIKAPKNTILDLKLATNK